MGLLALGGIAIAATSPLAAAPGVVPDAAPNEAQTEPRGDARNDNPAAEAEAGDLMTNLWSYTASIGAGVTAAWDSLIPPVESGLGTIDALIGDAYYYGHGVSRDYTEAARWYRRAAENSNAMAQSTLGDIYYYGRGVPQDFLEASEWWQLAADKGVAVAQLNLGVMYANGDGVPQDYVKAHFYTNLAAAHLPPGQDRDIAVKNRDIVGKLMNPGQIAEAQRLARIWRPKSSP
jgi:TPR repeat protein